jgi:linoleoyl-CoA desaturase
MSVKGVQFNHQDQPEFFKELRKRVNLHFKENNISKHANASMKFKTAFMICLYFVPLALMATGVVSSVWWMMLMWVIMGFGMSGIGLSIMHDANHGSYSKNRRVNSVLGFLVNFIGGYHINWKIQHNVLHHSFTNIDGLDGDIDTPAMRFSPTQKRRWIYKFQIIYGPLMYGLMSLYWFILKDFVQVFQFHREGLLEGQGTTFRKSLLEVTFNKLWYIGLTIVLPFIMMDVLWWQVILGWVVMEVISGWILAFIFQPAHVLEETSFFDSQEGSMENHWAIHQLRTTANFANGARLFSWLIGGLNFQIEHHLFPNICHVHYRNLSKIVKATAEEYNLPYHQHKTFAGAVKSHLTLLYELGTGKYDRKLVEVKSKAAA